MSSFNTVYGKLIKGFMDAEDREYRFDLLEFGSIGTVVGSTDSDSASVPVSSTNKFDVTQSTTALLSPDILIWQGDNIEILNETNESKEVGSVAVYVKDGTVWKLIGVTALDPAVTLTQDEAIEITGSNIEIEINPVLEENELDPGSVSGSIQLSNTDEITDPDVDYVVWYVYYAGTTDIYDSYTAFQVLTSGSGTSSGTYHITGLPEGTYDIVAEWEDTDNNEGPYEDQVNSVGVTQGTETQNIDFNISLSDTVD